MWQHQVILERQHDLLAAPFTAVVLPCRILRRRASFVVVVVTFDLPQQPPGSGVGGGTAVLPVQQNSEHILHEFMP